MNRLFAKRGIKILGVTLLIYALLVAPHEGEFWPFSIYPMFSKAGNPWARAMVLDVTGQNESEYWQKRPLTERRSDVVSVKKYGVDQIDFSNFVIKTDNWTHTRRQALISMFGKSNIGDQKWMVSRVKGKLVGDDSVAIQIEPFILLTNDTTYTNPHLPESEYHRVGQ